MMERPNTPFENFWELLMLAMRHAEDDKWSYAETALKVALKLCQKQLREKKKRIP